MSDPITTCIPCGDTVTARGHLFYHSNGSLACMVDNVQHITRTPDPAEPHCDFCNAIGVNWTLLTSSRINADILVYDDKTLDTIASQAHGMSEDWAACDECHDLIDAGDWDGVAARSIASVGTTNPDVLSAVKELHEQVRLTALGWMKNPGGKIPGR